MQPTETAQHSHDRAAKRHSLLVRRHLTRNYFVHALEGGLYMGGMQFLHSQTVMPPIIKSLGGPDWLIALMPVMSQIGFVAFPLLMAHRVEQMRRHKPFVVTVGIAQRLPYLLAGLALLFVGGRLPLLALVAVALVPLLSGLIGGLSATAWQEMVAKTLPPERRSSVWAVRHTISVLLGMVAGVVIAAVLGAFPQGDPKGYGILHLITFGFLVASYVVFLFLHETLYPRPPSGKALTLWENLGAMPGLIAGDVRLRRFILTSAAMAGQLIMLPFLSIHVLVTLAKPEAYLGVLLGVQMVGGLTGSLLAGWLGDRFGGKLPMLVGAATMAAICLWAPIATTTTEFLGIYLMLGVAFQTYNIGRNTLTLELCPIAKRASYLGIMATVSLPAMLVATQLGGAVWKITTESFAAVAYLAAIAIAASACLLLRVDDPRSESGGEQ